MPLFNAALDWGSWWVSRVFIKRGLAGGAGRVVLDLTWDGLAALGFMLALVLVLPLGIEFMNSLVDGAELDWRAMAVDAAADPWGQGLMVTGMVLTTLLPTFLHVVTGLFAVGIHGAAGRWLADQLEGDPAHPGSRVGPAIGALWTTLYVALLGAGVVLLIAGVLWLLDLRVACRLYELAGVFYSLPPSPCLP